MSGKVSFGKILKAASPSLATLWVLTLFGAGATMLPTVRALPNSWDDQIFQPGGLMLLESLRLHRSEFLSGLGTTLMHFLILQMVVLVARARLSAVLVDAANGRAPRAALFEKAPSYLLVSLLKVCAIFVGALLFGLVFSILPSLGGAMPPSLVLTHGAFLAVGMTYFGALVCLFDLYRLGLFVPSNWRERMAVTWSTFRRRAPSLLARRALWAVGSLGAGAVTLRVAAAPIFGGALTTFIVTQALVICILILELWWTFHAFSALEGERTVGAHSETA